MAKATTAIGVKAAQGSAKRREERDSGKGCVSGLYLVVQPSGAKSWVLRYRFGGKPRKLTLVEAKAFEGTSLAEVRTMAREKLSEIEQGRDPAREKVTERAAAEHTATGTTVAELVKAYDDDHLSTIRSGKSVRRYLDRFAVAEWGAQEVRSITTQDVRELLAKASATPILRNRLHSYLRHWFNWCVEQPAAGLAGSPMISVKRPQKRETKRTRFLSDDEIRWFWQASGKVGEPWGPMARILLLTGQRLNEVARMTDGEINGDVWHMSADRTKNGLTHLVPLSPQTVAVLNAKIRVKNPTGFIFSTNGESPVQGFHKARATLHDAMNEIARRETGNDAFAVPHWTFHALRHTVSTNFARLQIKIEVGEAALNHVSGALSGMAGTYNHWKYLDEKREALNKWAAFVTELVHEEAATVAEAAE